MIVPLSPKRLNNPKNLFLVADTTEVFASPTTLIRSLVKKVMMELMMTISLNSVTS